MDQRWATRLRTSDFDECSARTQESSINVHDDHTHQQTPFTSDVQSSTTFDDVQTRHQNLPSSTFWCFVFIVSGIRHVGLFYYSWCAHVLTSSLTDRTISTPGRCYSRRHVASHVSPRHWFICKKNRKKYNGAYGENLKKNLNVLTLVVGLHKIES